MIVLVQGRNDGTGNVQVPLGAFFFDLDFFRSLKHPSFQFSVECSKRFSAFNEAPVQVRDGIVTPDDQKQQNHAARNANKQDRVS